MEAKLLALLMKHQFANLSSDEEKEMNLLLNQEKENQQLYFELKDDRDKLIDYILEEIKSSVNHGEFDIEKAKARFFATIK